MRKPGILLKIDAFNFALGPGKLASGLGSEKGELRLMDRSCELHCDGRLSGWSMKPMAGPKMPFVRRLLNVI